MDFNHISRKLTQNQINELKSLYKTYHEQFWCYKRMFKKYKRNDIILKVTPIVLTTVGAAVGVITSNPIIIASLSGAGLMLQTITVQKNFTKKYESCRFAFQNYQKVLNKLKYMLRSGDFDDFLERELTNIDDEVSDLCPPIPEWCLNLYSKKFPST